MFVLFCKSCQDQANQKLYNQQDIADDEVSIGALPSWFVADVIVSQEYDFDYDDDDDDAEEDVVGDVENQYYKAKGKSI